MTRFYLDGLRLAWVELWTEISSGSVEKLSFHNTLHNKILGNFFDTIDAYAFFFLLSSASGKNLDISRDGVSHSIQESNEMPVSSPQLLLNVNT